MPLDGPETSIAVSDGPSGSRSLPSTPEAMPISSVSFVMPTYELSNASGGSLSGVTSIVTVAGAEF